MSREAKDHLKKLELVNKSIFWILKIKNNKNIKITL
jgi:hypothetical protein